MKLGDFDIIDTEIEKHPDAALIIEFEDEGQDCRYWHINLFGQVVSTLPSSSNAYNGIFVSIAHIKVGENL